MHSKHNNHEEMVEGNMEKSVTTMYKGNVILGEW